MAAGETGVEGATVVYPDGSVGLHEATLLVRPGEMLAVLGPSGSGKSSLLRAIAGLVPLRSGRVLIDGEPMSGPTERRDIAMVFEESHLIPFLTVARNLSFPLDVRHMPRDEIDERVQTRARALGLGRLLPAKPGALSHGERSRVGIGRALVRAPRAVLLDEPLAHLDAAERLRMRRHLVDVLKNAGLPTILVTHDPKEALAMGDRVAVLDHGTVVQVGPPREVYDEPVSTFVAEFVADQPIALLPARLVAADGMAGYQVGAHVLPTWAPPLPGLDAVADQPVLIGIRTEDVHERPQPDHGALTGTVARVEITGPYALVCVRVGAHEIHARFDRHTAVQPGATVTVGIDAARAHVFDSANGTALAHPT